MLKMVWFKNEMGQLVPKWVVAAEAPPLTYLLEASQPQPIHQPIHTPNRANDLMETQTEEPAEWEPLSRPQNIGIAAV
ncbi:hypothetical protein CWRG_00661 [Chthonomonas calidirosea]|uniref:Uncharacterized protein n=1 Tax=Chthonomonas calidirosea (strain DSM 23976 / ICMP 18418 / T49) TaxID=1303518 RepID=S0ESL9_CHTCT|nr:hypothetical protein [Chthonomonas calidirosea]CCW34321.1 hypothetical protein CCALI_00487 [Chthonomonas calidirosea T49]CEK13927.1 hypothetical protein CWRG_00661 [Chthonomonas calidirosea]CEK15111.1 hypothetical protein CTKA_00669 [Chthonomonas calidirosea]